MNYKEQKLLLNELREKRIKLEDLKDRTLYRLQARNIKIGVWSSKEEVFYGIRTKFGARFIDSENHWDAPNFATACPLEALTTIPDDLSLEWENLFSNKDKMFPYLFRWLEDKEKELGISPEEV